MITKYKTGGYSRNLIEAVECIKETEKCVFMPDTWNPTKTTRADKMAAYAQYHDSWEVARDYLRDKAKRRLDYAKGEVDSARAKLEKIEALQAPKAKP